MPKPSDWGQHHAEKPASDNGYFEHMSRVIFMSGLNWATLEKKWPGINQAFDNFDISKVAGYSESKIGELMQNPAVIRNRLKIHAIIANAREFQAVADQFGSFSKFLAFLRKAGGEEGLKSGLMKRFAFMGKGTTVIFLYSVGEDLPVTHAEWEREHGHA